MYLRTALFLLALVAGCATAQERVSERAGRRAADRHPAQEGLAERERRTGGQDDVYAVRVNRTLIYPVQHGRAEDLAETLRPLLESTYGPGVVVIPHLPTNHVFIQLPLAGAQGNRGAGAQGNSGARQTPRTR